MEDNENGHRRTPEAPSSGAPAEGSDRTVTDATGTPGAIPGNHAIIAVDPGAGESVTAIAVSGAERAVEYLAMIGALQQQANIANYQINQAKAYYAGPIVAVPPGQQQAAMFQAQAAQAMLQRLLSQGTPPTPPVWAPAPKIEDAGITVGEIVGWRCWRVMSGGVLRSVYRDTVWTPDDPMGAGPGVADLDLRADEIGAGWQDLGYGVHAWKSKADAFAYAAARLEPIIVGTVRLWGEVIEHERGYRAERAEIASLDWQVNASRADLRAACDLYGVGCRRQNDHTAADAKPSGATRRENLASRIFWASVLVIAVIDALQ